MFSSLDASGAYYAAFISPFGTFQYIRMDFGLANAGSVYTRMLDVAMKDEDRDFMKSYLADILTFSGEPWAHLRHLAQVVHDHMRPQESRYNHVRPSCSSLSWST